MDASGRYFKLGHYPDSLSLATFDANEYSVPTKYGYRELTVIATVDEVKIVHEDQVVARHPRCWDREQLSIPKMSL